MSNTKKKNLSKKKVEKTKKYGGGKKRSELIHQWISNHFYNNSKNTSITKRIKKTPITPTHPTIPASLPPSPPTTPPKLPNNVTEEKDILVIVQNLVNDNANIFVEFFKGLTENSENQNTDDKKGAFNLLNAIDAHINLLTILRIKTEIDIDTTTKEDDTAVKYTTTKEDDTIVKDTNELDDILKELLTHFNNKFEYVKKEDGFYYIKILIIPNWIPIDKSIKFKDVSDFLNKIKQYIKAAITFCTWTHKCSEPIAKLLNMYVNCDVNSNYANSYKLFKKLLLQFINENNTGDKFSNLIKQIRISTFQSAGRKNNNKRPRNK
jgi:hypothetical protein